MKKNSIKIILGEMGYIFMLLAGMLLVPFVSLFWAPIDIDDVFYFLIPAFMSFSLGIVLRFLFCKNIGTILSKSQQIAIVFLTWFSACIVFGAPFMFAGILNFSQAFFEASSGLSTTGLSVVDVTQVDHIFLMLRSVVQYFGGIGIILILVTIFNNSIGFELYKAEGHSDRLIPNVRESALTIVKIYTGFILMGFVGLVILGMPSFDAINIAICAVATGGFGVTPDSIAAYNSVPINLWIMVLMLLGSFSFYTNLLIVTGKFKKVMKIDELKLFLRLALIFTLISTFASMIKLFNFGHALMVSAFEVVSAITGTGFSITNYQSLIDNNQTFLFIIIIAMIIGGAVGSTAGGIKITRLNVVFSSIKWEIIKKISPNNKLIPHDIHTPVGKQKIRSSDIADASNYILLYLLVLVAGTIIFTIAGYPVLDSLFEFASALGNVGLTIGITSPDMSPILLWTLSIGMFIGRLEIYVILGFLARIVAKFRNNIHHH